MTSKKKDKDEKLTRIAIVNEDRCKPKKCNLDCKRNCPVVKLGFFFIFNFFTQY